MNSKRISRRAFSLIELMVVIVIITVLAALSLPAFESIKNRAALSSGLSNMRIISLGIIGYAGDHDQQIPGPLNTGLGPRYNLWTIGSLAQMIWEYTGDPQPLASGTQTSNVFTTPAFRAKRKSIDSPSFYSNHRIVPYTGSAFDPWGSVPVKMSLRNDFSKGETWALQDLDQLNAPTGAGWASFLPPKPIYGNKRVTLYFDWHVEAVSAP